MRIGFLLREQGTQLDRSGPAQVLSRLEGAQMVYVGASTAPVATDCGFSILPTTTREACPQLDLVCAPGGYGVAGVMGDPVWTDFVADQARGASHVTSVCTGAFILGAAGLLKGKRATTHWAYHDLLALFGAIATAGRSVTDGALTTGGGVTAGLDFALALVGEIAGPEFAQTVQLSLEYDPAPPVFDGAASAADLAAILKAGPFAARRAVMAAASRDALSRLA